MSVRYWKGNRIGYRKLIEKELVKCKELIGSTEHEHSQANLLWRKVRICVRRLEGLIEGLVQANERLSIVIEGQGEAQYVENLIDKDWAYISVVTDCCYNLVNIENSVKKFPVVICSANQLKRQSAQIDQILMNERQQQLRNNLEDGTGGEDCYSCVNSTADVDSYGSGGEDCYSCVNSTADVDSYGTGGEDCYSCVNSTVDVDSYGSGGEDCYSCVNSTVDVNSYGSGDEDCYSCVNSTADVDSYGTGGEDCYSCVNSTANVDSYGSGGEDCYSCVNSTVDVDSYGSGGEDCYSCVNSTADVDSYVSGGEDCYSCVNSTADLDRYGSGGKDCYSYANSTGGFDSYGTSVEDCFSCVDSTGKKDDSSLEDQSPGKWCCSLNISTFHEEFFSCYNSNRNMYCYMCTDGKKGRYVNNLECARSGEDYTGFEDRDRGKPRKFCLRGLPLSRSSKPV